MAKKIRTVVTLQLPAGKATPAPPVGTVLGPHGINLVEFTKSYNEKTAAQSGQVIPAQITIFEDRSFTFILKTPPSADMLRKAAGLDKGSATASRTKVGSITRAQVREIAQIKMADLNAIDLDAATRTSRAPPAPWASRSPDSTTGRRSQRAGPAREPRLRWHVHPASPGGGPPGPHGGMHMPKHGKRYGEVAKLVDRDPVYAPDAGGRPAQGDREGQLRSVRRGTHPPRRRSRAMPTRWSAARSCCRTASARPSACSCSPRATRRQEALKAGADEVGGEDLVKSIEAG